jgi:hypothetical protein
MVVMIRQRTLKLTITLMDLMTMVCIAILKTKSASQLPFDLPMSIQSRAYSDFGHIDLPMSMQICAHIVVGRFFPLVRSS